MATRHRAKDRKRATHTIELDGELLRGLRRARGWRSQEAAALAAAANGIKLSKSVISKAERGLPVAEETEENLKKLYNIPDDRLQKPLFRLRPVLDVASLSPIERCADSKGLLYRQGDLYVSAARLWGAAGVYVTQGCCRVTYKPILFKVPKAFKPRRDRHVALKKKDAKGKYPFDNGTVCRLMSFGEHSCKRFGVTKERKGIEIEIRPLKWYDFEGMNGARRGTLNVSEDFEHYLRLSDLLETKDVNRSRLTNIVDCNVTIVTTDGFAAYVRRGNLMSSVPGMLSSSVSENMNPYKDDTWSDDSLVNNPSDWAGKKRVPDPYLPKYAPHPFSTARRGIGEELSPLLPAFVRPLAIKLCGLCYNLEGYHPDFLFVAAIDLTRDEVAQRVDDEPGEDFRERGSKLGFIRASFEDAETRDLLRRRDWVPGDEASLFRTLQLITSLQRMHGSFSTVFRILAEEP